MNKLQQARMAKDTQDYTSAITTLTEFLTDATGDARLDAFWMRQECYWKRAQKENGNAAKADYQAAIDDLKTLIAEDAGNTEDYEYTIDDVNGYAEYQNIKLD